MKLLLFITLSLSCLVATAQEQSESYSNIKTYYYIKKAQKLYTKISHNTDSLVPYRKEVSVNINGQQIDTVETAAYEQRRVNGIPQPHGDFTIYKTITTGKEVKYEVKKKVLEKESRIRLQVQITKSDDKVTVKLARGIRADTDPYKRNAKYINSEDNESEFYWSIEDGEEFKYYSLSTVVGAISLPFKVRLGGDNRPSTIETGLDNIGFYVGEKWGSTTYKNGEFKYWHTTLAAFIGPQKITINKDNTKSGISETIDRLGLTTGAAWTISRGSFTIGLAGGLDILGGRYRNEWIYNKKPWIGLAVGYKIGFL
jgi:hypothetical protein